MKQPIRVQECKWPEGTQAMPAWEEMAGGLKQTWDIIISLAAHLTVISDNAGVISSILSPILIMYFIIVIVMRLYVSPLFHDLPHWKHRMTFADPEQCFTV